MDLPTPDPLYVRVLTRVVAAGFFAKGSDQYLRASLCFLPEPVSDSERGDPSVVDLTQWPTAIENALGGVATINVTPVPESNPAILPAANVSTAATKWKRLVAKPRDPETMKYLTGLWQRLLAPPLTVDELNPAVYSSPKGPRPTEDSWQVLKNYPDQYDDAVKAFAKPWLQISKALTKSLGADATQQITKGSDAKVFFNSNSIGLPRVSTVPYAEAGLALSAMRVQAISSTVHGAGRQPAPDQPVFLPKTGRVRNSPATGAMTKLGRLAVGGNSEPLGNDNDEDDAKRAVRYAAARNVLANPQTLLAFRREKDPARIHQALFDRVSAVFQWRYGNEKGAVPPRSYWLGKSRDPSRWRFTKILADSDFKAKVAARNGTKSPDPTAALGRLAVENYTELAGDALLHHFMAMRHVPRQFTPAQMKAIKDAEKKGTDEADRRKRRGKQEADCRRYDRAAKQLVDAAGRRFFGLQSFPSLARLFNLVVDVEIKLSGRDAAGLSGLIDPKSTGLHIDEDAVDFDAADLDSGKTANIAKAYYLLLNHEFTTKPDRLIDGTQSIWSTAKFRRSGPIGAGHFWPVTHDEIEVAQEITAAAKDSSKPVPDDSRAPQYDGIVDLGFAKDDKARFELDNLDSVQALEQYANSLESTQAQTEGGARSGHSGQGWGAFRSGGLALLDTMCADRAASDTIKTQMQVGWRSQPAASRGKSAAAVLDANDLSIGFRVDVGVRPRGKGNDHRFVWRSLMNRLISYGDPEFGINGDIKKQIKELLPALGLSDEEQLRLDAGLVRSPSKLVALDINRDPNKAEAVANENLATWTGDPLGLECGGASDVAVDPARDLPLTIVYDLPKDAGPNQKIEKESYTPPRLEFGRGYRVGLRAVYLGGVALPLERAAARYEDAKDGTLTLPARGSGGHRFLRQEPIDPPLVAMAEQVLKEYRDKDMPWDSAEWAVVRSGPDRRLSPSKTWRVVVPPAVSMEYAVLHRISAWQRTVGHENSTGLRLVDGLVNVDIDPRYGGFPHLDEGRRNISHFPDSKVPTPKDKQVYDAIFRAAPTSDEVLARRLQPYYPDPAARQLAIAVVTRGADGVTRDSLVVRLDDPVQGVRYPDYAPVLIEIRALKSSDARPRIVTSDAKADVGVVEPGGQFRPQAWSAWRQSNGNARVRRVVIHLRPGEDYDLTMWCPPLAEDLARWFQSQDNLLQFQHLIGSIEQTVAADSQLVAGVLNATGLSKAATNDDKLIVRGMIALLGEKQAAQFAADAKRIYNSAPPSAFSDITNVDGVSPALLRTVSEFVARRALDVPVPGLSQFRTIRVTHAVQLPQYAPCFPALGSDAAACLDTQDGEQLLAVVRKEFDDSATPPASPTGSPPPAGNGVVKRADWLLDNRNPAIWNDPSLPNRGHDPGASDSVFGGRVAVDVDTTSQLTIWANAAIVADDIRRTRKRSAQLPKPDATMSIYGFNVAVDGTVSFPQQRIELLRTRDISGEIYKQREDGPLTKIEQPEILDLAFTPGAAVREFERRYRFTEPRAVELKLQLEARSRFEHMLVREVDRGGKPPEMPDPITVQGARTSFWLPATKRPDPIDRKSLLPAFIWTEKSEGMDVERRTVVRIRMKRPWFSSGEGEKLGIVLWPPEILDLTRRSYIARDCVLDECERLGEDAARAKLANFEDIFLGPGGQYITRWGTDPIRQGPVQTGFFMPLEAFRDAFSDSKGHRRAEPVRDVQLPIPRGDNETPPTGGAGTDPSPQNTMLVSLLAYEPKFDPVDESWYVDAEISSLAMAYPFVRLGLVRYQEHAPPEWQVSEPIVEFIQLLPRRHVVVTREEAAPKDGYPVCIKVFGPGSDAVALNVEDIQDAGTQVASLHRPVLKAKVLCHATAAPSYAGTPDKPIAAEVLATGHDGKLLEWTSFDQTRPSQPRRDEPGLEWICRFVLKDDPATTPHFIFLEEVEWMLPTDPVAESERQGLPPGSDSIIAESGPRFALKARIR